MRNLHHLSVAATVWLYAVLIVALPPVAAAESSDARGAATTPPKARIPKQIGDFSYSYGVYIGGKKVGTMTSSLKRLPFPRLVMHLDAEVLGMGKTSQVTLAEERRYNGVGGLLHRISFEQAAEGAKVSVSATRRSGKMAMSVTAGGAVHKVAVASDERLDDALAQQRLATGLTHKRLAIQGDTAHSVHLDASTQKVVHAEHEVVSIENALVAGVATEVLTVATRYPELHIEEHSTLDREGKLLSTKIGGLFEARLEPPEIARRRDAPGDVLLGAVVKTPHALSEPTSLDEMRVTLAGLSFAPESSARQQVQKLTDSEQSAATGAEKSGRYALILRREPELGAVAFVPQRGRRPLGTGKGEPDPATRMPSAFIQSDHPEIRGTALRAVQGQKTERDAMRALCHFVRNTLTSSYVPSFSNALEALHTKRGDCTEHSVLFVALARAVGLAARPVVGLAYWPPGGGFGWHAWAEVYTEGRWVAVDPTWDQPLADATHIKLAEGDADSQARVVMLLGRLRVESLWP